MGGGGDKSNRESRYTETEGASGREESRSESWAEDGPTSLDPDDPCARLIFITMLSSPEPDVVEGLVIAARLDVALQNDSGVQLVVALTVERRVAGTITDRLAELIPCLEAGRRFAAVLLSIDGGAVELRIEPAQ